jgi:hypothetical protein
MVTLRQGLLLALALLLVVSLVLVSVGALPGWSVLVSAVALGAAVLFERRGYQPRVPDPSALRPTDERFQDPTSGEPLEVWEDPCPGAREDRPASERQ